MKHRIRFAAALFAACTAKAFAEDGAMTAAPLAATSCVADCAFPRLPTQGQVAEWTGLHNLGQVYAARERLMAVINSACQQRGIARLPCVSRSLGQGQSRIVAVEQHVR